MDPIIAELVKAQAITQAKASILRGWAAIRNKAAHGEFGEFSSADVKSMIGGVKTFIDEVY